MELPAADTGEHLRVLALSVDALTAALDRLEQKIAARERKHGRDPETALAADAVALAAAAPVRSYAGLLARAYRLTPQPPPCRPDLRAV